MMKKLALVLALLLFAVLLCACMDTPATTTTGTSSTSGTSSTTTSTSTSTTTSTSTSTSTTSSSTTTTKPSDETAITAYIYTPMKEVTAVIAFEDEISLLEIVAYIEANYEAVISSADEWFWMDGCTLLDVKTATFTESKTISYIGSGMGQNVEFIFIDEFGTASEGATYPCPAMYLSSFVRFLEEIHAFEETAGTYTYNGEAANANTVIDGGTVVFTENESVAPYTVNYVYNGTSGSFTLEYAITLSQLLQKIDPSIEYYNEYTHRVTLDGSSVYDGEMTIDYDCTLVADAIYEVYVNVSSADNPQYFSQTFYGPCPTAQMLAQAFDIDPDKYVWELRSGYCGAAPDGPLFTNFGMNDVTLRPLKVQINASFVRENGMTESREYLFEGNVPVSEVFAQFFAYNLGTWTVKMGENGTPVAIDDSYIFACNTESIDQNYGITVYYLAGATNVVNVRVILNYPNDSKMMVFNNVPSGKTLGALLEERGYSFSDFTDWFGYSFGGTSLSFITASTTFTAGAEISAQYCGASATVVYNGTHYTCLLEEDMTLEDIINAVYLSPYDGAWKVTGPDGVFYPSLSTVLPKTASDGSPAIYTITQNNEAVRIFYYTGEYFYVNGDAMQFVNAGEEWAPQEAFASVNPFVRFLYWAAEKDGTQVRINDADDLFALGASEVELIPVYEADMSALMGTIHSIEMGEKLYITESGVIYRFGMDSMIYGYGLGDYSATISMAGVRFETVDGFVTYVDGCQVDTVVNEPIFFIYDLTDYRFNFYAYKANEYANDYSTEYYRYEQLLTVDGRQISFADAADPGVYIIYVRYIGE